MKYIEVNKKFTEAVADYLSRGYIIKSSTMGGSQGEIAKVDVTDGVEIIRIKVADFRDWKTNLEGIEVVTGVAVEEDPIPHRHGGWNTIWDNQIEVLERVRFYEVGDTRYHGKHYGTEDEAKAAAELRLRRYIIRHAMKQTVIDSPEAMRIAKSYIQRTLGAKRIPADSIKVRKTEKSYLRRRRICRLRSEGRRRSCHRGRRYHRRHRNPRKHGDPR